MDGKYKIYQKSKVKVIFQHVYFKKLEQDVKINGYQFIH